MVGNIRKRCSLAENIQDQFHPPLESFCARETFTVVHDQTSVYGQKTTHSNAWVVLFSPSLCVHANLGQQSTAAIHFLDHVWHYHQPKKRKGGRTPSLSGRPLLFYSWALVVRDEPNAQQFPFLRKLDEHSPAHSCPACSHTKPSFGVFSLFTCSCCCWLIYLQIKTRSNPPEVETRRDFFV